MVPGMRTLALPALLCLACSSNHPTTGDPAATAREVPSGATPVEAGAVVLPKPPVFDKDRGFWPLRQVELESMQDQTVYLSRTVQIGGTWVYAGEPVVLRSCATTPVTVQNHQGNEIKGERYERCTVQPADGKSGTVSLLYLSRTPLHYNLREPGTAQDLLLNVFRTAFPLPWQQHEINAQYGYRLRPESTVMNHQGKTLVGEDFYQAKAMELAFDFAKELVHLLVHGSSYAKDSILRDHRTRWIALAQDTTILDWWAEGIPDKQLKARLENADSCLGTLEWVDETGEDAAKLLRELEKRPWARQWAGLPADKVAVLESQAIATRTREVEQSRVKIQHAFEYALKMWETLKP